MRVPWMLEKGNDDSDYEKWDDSDLLSLNIWLLQASCISLAELPFNLIVQP